MQLFQWIIRILVLSYWRIGANTKTTATAKRINRTRACINGQLTLHCGVMTDVNKIVEIEWEIKFPGDSGWTRFSYCSKKCIVEKQTLPEGIKVLNISMENVTIERSEENRTNDRQAMIQCVVHYENTAVTHLYGINFTLQCEWAVEGEDLDLTAILRKLVPCERTDDVDWFLTNDSNFAYCKGCQRCTKANTDNRYQERDFRKRLRYTGGLILTNIQDSDHQRCIVVKVHIETDAPTQAVRRLTIRILVKKGRDSPPSYSVPATVATTPALLSTSRTSTGKARSNRTGPSTKPFSPSGIENSPAPTNTPHSVLARIKTDSSVVHRLAWTSIVIGVTFAFCISER